MSRGFVRAGFVAAVVGLVLLGDATAAPVLVDQGEVQYKLTVAARVCRSFTDVTANLARNNIQESLRDLGADTLYTPGQPINPDLEAQGQPNCRPLPSAPPTGSQPPWRFTLGTGIGGMLADEQWGSLSFVSGAFDTSIVTQPSTPLLDLNGQPVVPHRDLAGAVTITLTQAEADRAAQGPSRLWIQGGTVNDPVLNQQFPGGFGFAALRCSVDNLNGDNVEWITFPQGTTHAFCFAYYVSPPPRSGTITVIKHVTEPAAARQVFPFHGNISFNPGGVFSLAVNAGQTASAPFSEARAETRSGEAPWTFTEDSPAADWHLEGISCNSETGESSFTTSVADRTASVTLAAGDHVTCIYTDSRTPPPPGSLSITKTTLGGVGSFGYTVTGGGSTVNATATTTTPGITVAATPDPLTVGIGTHTITETLPSSRSGTWALTAVTCNGSSLPAVSPVTVTVEPGQSVVCNFENTFTPRGSIRIEKVTFGNTRTAAFQIRPLAPLPQDVTFTQTANVTRQGVPTVATGDSTNALPLGSYRIQEFATTGANPRGWALTSVVCSGRLLAAAQGAVTVTLTEAQPRLRCIFTNRWTPEPPPQPPQTPDPIATADIRVNKTPNRVTATVGDTVIYTITVRNVGNATTATGVILAEQWPLQTSRIISLTTTHGTCRFDHHPAWCDVGLLAPSKTVTITAKLRATHVGSMPNNVAVDSDTLQVRPPIDHTPGRVRPRPRPKPGHFTG